MSLFSEIKRRRVVQGTIAYAVAGWLIIQLAIALEAALELPAYVDRWVTIVVIAGLPIAIILSWVFDISLGRMEVTGSAAAQPNIPEQSLTEGARPQAPPNSIAVLPFVDMSPDRDQEYLGDGVAEEILNALVQVTPLSVSGRTSSFSYKGKDASIKKIGEELSVVHVLEGSVRKQGDKVRITAQLIKADDEFHIWSDTYDGDLSDIFDLQDTIAKEIVSALELVLDVDKVRLVEKLTSSAEAYELYLRGRKLAAKQNGKGVLAQAIDLLKRAVELDPEFAQAWSMLSVANYWILEHTYSRAWKAAAEAGKEAAQRAFALDPSGFHARSAKSIAETMEGRFGEAIDLIQVGYEGDPTNPSAKYTWGLTQAAIGLVDAGHDMIMEVVDKDPRSASAFTVAGHILWAKGEIDKARRYFKRSIDLGYWGGMSNTAALMAQEDSPKAAAAYFDANIQIMGDIATRGPLKNKIVRYLYIEAAFGRQDWARRLLKIGMSRVLTSENAIPSSVGPYTAVHFGDARLFFKMVRKKPHPYLASSLLMLWMPTDVARAIRTHKDFPQFAQDIGFVKAWQTHGWPRWVTPTPGTDGSNLQFSVA